MLTVTKRFEFAYAHRLPGYEGKCKNLHGHTGIIEIEVSGPPKDRTKVYPTMVCDFSDLKGIVQQEVILILDHKFLNDVMEYPTAETMSEWIWDRLYLIFGDHLVRIRVYETPNSWAELKT